MISLGYIVWAGGLFGLALAYHHVPAGYDSVWRLVPRAGLVLGDPWPYGHFLVVAAGSLIACWAGHMVLLSEHALPRLVGAVAGTAVVLTFVFPPVLSGDVFTYTDLGLTVRAGVSPYVTPPAEALDASVRHLDVWAQIRSPYGPLWLALCGVVALPSNDPRVAALGFQLFGAAALTAATIVLARIAGPGRAAAFGTNPLVILESAAAGHVDVFVTLLVLSAAIAHLYQRSTVTALFVGLAAACKLNVLLLVPLVMARAASLTAALRVGLVVLVTLLIAYVPFVAHGEVLAPLTATLAEARRSPTNPIWGIPRTLALQTLPPAIAEPLMAALAAAVIVGAALVGAWRVSRDRREGSGAELRDLAWWAGLATVVTAVAPRSYTWYWMLPAGLAAAQPVSPRLRFAVRCITAAMTVVYVVLVPDPGHR